MKRKITALCVVIAMLAVAIISGTMAYFTDTDEAVNVMVMGNVKIQQNEMQRDEAGTALVPFKQGKEMLPVPSAPQQYIDLNGTTVGSDESAYKFLADKDANSLPNVIDKIVTVENTGKSDAYVRTIFGFEIVESVNEIKGTEEQRTIKFMRNEKKNDGAEGNSDWTWEWLDEIAVINGQKYAMAVATHEAILEPGDETIPNLLQVYLKSEVEQEYAAKFGISYEVLTLTQAAQAAGFDSADAALNEAFGVPTDTDLTRAVSGPVNAAVWLGAITDPWDGTADTSWYDKDLTEYTLISAEQIAGLSELVDGGETFEGKTIKLGFDLDLYAEDENGEPICFDPIGSYRNDTAFKGVFDGQGHTIYNLSQNTWVLDNGYYYGDLGLGLFAYVEDATVKNLVMDGASISGETAICGVVAATSYGDCTFENITVSNTQCNDYQYYAGGIVGWASGNHQYININVDASTIIGSQWGDFGNASGGIIGGIGSSAKILMKDCTVACRIDAVNDVVSAYQWYNYRNCGMLIGKVPQEIKNGEAQTVKTPENVTCENVKVIYGDWANYHYCEFAGTGYPFVRVEAGVSVDAYSNVRYGHPTDANGNTVVDDNHVHNDGEAHMELIEFDQLFGGPGNARYSYYGISTYDGVTVVYNNK